MQRDGLAGRPSGLAVYVAAVAEQLGVGWSTVMRAVRNYGTDPLIDDPARLVGGRGRRRETTFPERGQARARSS